MQQVIFESKDHCELRRRFFPIRLFPSADSHSEIEEFRKLRKKRKLTKECVEKAHASNVIFVQHFDDVKYQKH